MSSNHEHPRQPSQQQQGAPELVTVAGDRYFILNWERQDEQQDIG